MISFLVDIARHGQSPQTDNFTISLQYFKKEVWDEVDFSYADKHQTFSQVDKINYGGHS